MGLPQQAAEVLQLGGGLETRVADDLVEASRCIGVVNWEFTETPGAAITRKGFDEFTTCPGSGQAYMLRKFYTSDDDIEDYLIVQRGSKLYRAQGNDSNLTLVASNVTQAFPDTVQVDDSAVLVNGTDMLRSSDGGQWISAINKAPDVKPGVAAGAAGSATGAYEFAYAFLYGVDGKWGIGPLSPFSSAIVLSNQRAVLTLSAGPQGVTARRVFATSKSSFGQVYELADISNNTQTTWTTPPFTEEDLAEPGRPDVDEIPLSDRIEIHGPYAFYVPVDDLSKLVPSLEGEWFIQDFHDVIEDIRDHDGAHISDLKHLSRDCLLVFTETKVWALRGADPRTWEIEIIYDVGMPRGGFRTTVAANGRCYWKSRRHVYETNGYRAGTKPISLPIEKLLDSLASSDTEIAGWLACYYRPKGWYMLFAKGGSSGGAYGAFDAVHPVDLSTPPVVGPVTGGVGEWNALPDWSNARLCLVYDVDAGQILDMDRWTAFDIDAIVASSLEGPGDVGLVHFMPQAAASTGSVRRFERTDGVHADIAAAINSKLLTPRRAEGTFTSDKQLDDLFWLARTFGGATTGYHAYVKDLGSSAFVEQLDWSAMAQVRRMKLPANNMAHHQAFYIGHTSATKRLQVQGYSPIHRVLPRR